MQALLIWIKSNYGAFASLNVPYMQHGEETEMAKKSRLSDRGQKLYSKEQNINQA